MSLTSQHWKVEAGVGAVTSPLPFALPDIDIDSDVSEFDTNNVIDERQQFQGGRARPWSWLH